MDYINDLTDFRLKKVIEGEQGGISKAVEWQGGGSFVYAELAAYNSAFADRIDTALNMATLQTIHGDMRATGLLRFDVRQLFASIFVFTVKPKNNTVMPALIPEAMPKAFVILSIGGGIPLVFCFFMDSYMRQAALIFNPKGWRVCHNFRT